MTAATPGQADDMRADPPFACTAAVEFDGGKFACCGTPGHAGKHSYLIMWNGQGALAAQGARPALRRLASRQWLSRSGDPLKEIEERVAYAREQLAQAAVDVFLAGDSVSAESIREALASQDARPAPGALALQLIIAVDALRLIHDGLGVEDFGHDIAHLALDDIGTPGFAEPQPAPELRLGPCPFEHHVHAEHLRLNTHGYWLCAVTLTDMLVAADVITDLMPAPGLAAYEADIASLTDQRNHVSDTADRLRMQVRHLRNALERCRDSADRSPSAVHAIASQALASSQEDDL